MQFEDRAYETLLHMHAYPDHQCSKGFYYSNKVLGKIISNISKKVWINYRLLKENNKQGSYFNITNTLEDNCKIRLK